MAHLTTIAKSCKKKKSDIEVHFTRELLKRIQYMYILILNLAIIQYFFEN